MRYRDRDMFMCVLSIYVHIFMHVYCGYTHMCVPAMSLCVYSHVYIHVSCVCVWMPNVYVKVFSGKGRSSNIILIGTRLV